MAVNPAADDRDAEREVELVEEEAEAGPGHAPTWSTYWSTAEGAPTARDPWDRRARTVKPR
jgi:hypothetical protein